MTRRLPKTIIIGATGLLGKEFFQAHREADPGCVGTTRDPARRDFACLDLFSPDIAPLKLAASGYQDALILAGISKIATCQENKALARKINYTGTVNLIEQLVDEGIKPIFFSSDYVFNGKSGGYDDEAVADPLNEYGRHKAEIEAHLKQNCHGKYLVVRLSKIFSLEKGDGTIFDEMASILSSGRTVRSASDQIFSLTLISDLVNVVTALQRHNATGIYNICSPEVWSRYDLALRMAECLGGAPAKVAKISLDELGESFTRPKNTSMVTKRLDRDINYKFTPIMHCIKKIAENWMASKLTR